MTTTPSNRRISKPSFLQKPISQLPHIKLWQDPYFGGYEEDEEPYEDIDLDDDDDDYIDDEEGDDFEWLLS